MRKRIIKKRMLERKRTFRVRKKLKGNSTRPRMCVVKSNQHIHVQLIDDETGTTLGDIATFSKEYRKTKFGKKNKEAARTLGEHVAKIAQEKNIKEVIFDRGPFKYHGILAELANAARAGGLQF